MWGFVFFGKVILFVYGFLINVFIFVDESKIRIRGGRGGVFM